MGKLLTQEIEPIQKLMYELTKVDTPDGATELLEELESTGLAIGVPQEALLASKFGDVQTSDAHRAMDDANNIMYDEARELYINHCNGFGAIAVNGYIIAIHTPDNPLEVDPIDKAFPGYAGMVYVKTGKAILLGRFNGEGKYSIAEFSQRWFEAAWSMGQYALHDRFDRLVASGHTGKIPMQFDPEVSAQGILQPLPNDDPRNVLSQLEAHSPELHKALAGAKHKYYKASGLFDQIHAKASVENFTSRLPRPASQMTINELANLAYTSLGKGEDIN